MSDKIKLEGEDLSAIQEVDNCLMTKLMSTVSSVAAYTVCSAQLTMDELFNWVNQRDKILIVGDEVTVENLNNTFSVTWKRTHKEILGDHTKGIVNEILEKDLSTGGIFSYRVTRFSLLLEFLYLLNNVNDRGTDLILKSQKLRNEAFDIRSTHYVLNNGSNGENPEPNWDACEGVEALNKLFLKHREIILHIFQMNEWIRDNAKPQPPNIKLLRDGEW